MEHFLKILHILIPGVGWTVGITIIAVTLGIIIGMIMALFKLSNNVILKVIANVYIEPIRGTPLYVQIFLFHFGVASLIGQLLDIKFNFPIPVTAIVVLALNSGAYVAEIFRAGIQSIDKGQNEAARSLGMSHRQSMRYIILPQAFKVVIPALANEFVMLLKDTSLLAAIGLAEIMKRSQIYVAASFDAFAGYATAALLYFVITFTLTRFINRYEKKLSSDMKQAGRGRKRKKSIA